VPSILLVMDGRQVTLMDILPSLVIGSRKRLRLCGECKSALLGFTKVNNAHNGKRLGGALFKVLDRVGIAHKVFSFPFRLPVAYIIFHLGHVTCDNASNNGTMLQEFARLFELRFKKEFPWDERRIK
jgi:hypothetical protein